MTDEADPEEPWRRACGEVALHTSAAASAAATATGELARILELATRADTAVQALGAMISTIADLSGRAPVAHAAVRMAGFGALAPSAGVTVEFMVRTAMGSTAGGGEEATAERAAGKVLADAAACARRAAESAAGIVRGMVGEGWGQGGSVACRAEAAVEAAAPAGQAVLAALESGLRAVTHRPPYLRPPATAPEISEVVEDSRRAAAHLTGGAGRIGAAIAALREQAAQLAEAGVAALLAAEQAEAVAGSEPLAATDALAAADAALAASRSLIMVARGALIEGARVTREVGLTVSDAAECAGAAALAATVAVGTGRLDWWLERRGHVNSQAGVVAPAPRCPFQ